MTQMTEEQQQTIDLAVVAAMEAGHGNFNDRQLTEWVMEHRYPSFPQDIKDALCEVGLETMIGEGARVLWRSLISKKASAAQ